ncbi:hypothetical protein [Actinopolyspora mzabensis]|uniref:hypothetical protein n=1 Tax=Actinopolyspora mzabensis TaxID=995066 RepID=UPI00115FED3E|nr:hypothetical protein [Actinopolyspora mzabensis]
MSTQLFGTRGQHLADVAVPGAFQRVESAPATGHLAQLVQRSVLQPRGDGTAVELRVLLAGLLPQPFRCGAKPVGGVPRFVGTGQRATRERADDRTISDFGSGVRLVVRSGRLVQCVPLGLFRQSPLARPAIGKPSMVS